MDKKQLVITKEDDRTRLQTTTKGLDVLDALSLLSISYAMLCKEYNLSFEDALDGLKISWDVDEDD